MSISGGGVLVRLDTSVLERRLDGLTDQWEDQVRGIRDKVDDCSASVRAVSDDVAAIQRFLLSYHKREMTSALSTDGEASQPPSDPLEHCATPPTATTTPTESLLRMVTIARRLLADNAALRSSLDQATTALASYNVTHVGLQEEVVRLRDLTTLQSERLQSMADWLGMSGLSIGSGPADATAANSEGADGADVTAPPSAAVLEQSTEAVLSRSPLLLSFRRFLLRDLTERLTSVVNQQSKDFHDSVAHLENRIQSGQCVVVGAAEAPQGVESSEDLQETVRTLTKRLKELDQRAVKRDEFTALMRSKADSLLLPVKADSAAVTDLEKRLASRCADLEERCAYADAERAEFRAILRSLIAAQSAPPPTSSRPSGRSSPETAASAATTQRSGATLRDVLPTLQPTPQAGSAPPLLAQKSFSNGSSRGVNTSSPPPPLQQQQQQQLCRVVGTSQGVGVHGVPSAVGHDSPAAASSLSVGGASGSRREPSRPQSTPARSEEETAAVAIGMTASQGSYATYVSQQLNRKQVAALPTLPYERMTNAP